MKNEGKTDKVNDQIKEILYIEMVHQQMETFIRIDELIKTRQIDTKTSNIRTS